MPLSYAYAGYDYDEYLDWCAHNPEDQNVGDYAPDYTEDVNIDCLDIDNRVPGDINGAGTSPWPTHGHHYGILDGGATSTCGSFELIQLIADAWEPLDRFPTLENSGGRDFVFAG